MNTTVVATLITVLGSISAVATTYWFSKKREREAEWRKEKLEHYKAFVASLSGVLVNESTPAGQQAFARACNNLMLIAPTSVIDALKAFQEEIKISNPKKDDSRHDKLMAALFLEMRRDLQILPPDDPENFSFKLWAAGPKPE